MPSPLAWCDAGPKSVQKPKQIKSRSLPTLQSPLADATLIEVDLRAKARNNSRPTTMWPAGPSNLNLFRVHAHSHPAFFGLDSGGHMFDESLGLTVLAEHNCDEYEDGQKQFLAQFVAAKPRCGGLLNTKANFDCGKSRVTTPLLVRQLLVQVKESKLDHA
ncbi:unnamed protein product [Effrenium voratum]|uniref:Uncharacterized protein n=1 Tax=Effrenium voratum TaxID=2562239 RepID=A0AA36IEY7_9DINO|nr:unnamed protein product [Effrenium voratum]